MRSSSTFSVLFWVYGKRAVKNQANIYVRITVNGKRVNISLKKKIDLSIWDEKSQRAKGSSRDSRMLNLFLSEVQSKIYRIYEGLKLSENEISSQTIKSKFLGEDKRHFSFQELIDYYNEKMQHKLHKNTLGHYKTSQRYMMQYILRWTSRYYCFRKKQIVLLDKRLIRVRKVRFRRSILLVLY